MLLLVRSRRSKQGKWGHPFGTSFGLEVSEHCLVRQSLGSYSSDQKLEFLWIFCRVHISIIIVLHANLEVAVRNVFSQSRHMGVEIAASC